MKHFSKFLNETYHAKEKITQKQKKNDGISNDSNITSFMRSGLVILSVILLASIAVAYGGKNIDTNPVTAVFGSRISNKELPIYCVDTSEKKVALSFDAACANYRYGHKISIKWLTIAKNGRKIKSYQTGGLV